MRGPDLTVGQRLALGFGVPLLALAGMTAAIVGWQARAEREQQHAVEQYDDVSRAAHQLERSLLGGAPAGIGSAEAAALRESTLRALGEMRARQRGEFAEAMARFQEDQQRLYRRLLVALLLAVALMVAASAWAAYSLRTPILELLSGAMAIEQGDLSQALKWSETLAPESRSEIRQLARALGAAAFALQRRDRRVRADRRIADAAASSLVATEIAAEALAAIVGKMHAGLGLIYFADTKSALLKPAATHAAGPAVGEIRFGEGLAGQAAQDRRLVVLRDIPPDAGFRVRLGYDEAPPRCVAAAPIIFKEQVLGVAVVGALHNFDDYSLSFLESAAAQLAAGLQNSIAHAQLRKLADDLRDEHQKVQAQAEELHAQNEELQTQGEELQAQGEEIQAQNEQLKSLADQLTLADARKNDFLAMLAHELRNPLAAISNAQHLLSRPNLAGEVVESARRVIGRQTRQLTRLMEDLLDTARIVRGTLQVRSEPLSLTAVIRDCMEDMRPELDQAGMRLELELPDAALNLLGDRARLAQAVCNMCNNAIKFRRQGGTLRVDLRAAGEYAELTIADDGLGIDPAFLSRVFEPFAQANPRGDGNGGLGLGLSVVKALVESHGGTITVRSAGQGQGTEFTLRLPLSRQAQEP